MLEACLYRLWLSCAILILLCHDRMFFSFCKLIEISVFLSIWFDIAICICCWLAGMLCDKFIFWLQYFCSWSSIHRVSEVHLQLQCCLLFIYIYMLHLLSICNCNCHKYKKKFCWPFEICILEGFSLFICRCWNQLFISVLHILTYNRIWVDQLRLVSLKEGLSLLSILCNIFFFLGGWLSYLVKLLVIVT